MNTFLRHRLGDLSIIILILLGTGAIPAAAQLPAPLTLADPAGHWEGSVQLPGTALDVKVDLAHGSGGAWTGAIDIPQQHSKGLPLKSITVDRGSVSFSIAGVPGNPTFSGTLSADSTTIAGNFSQSGASFPFKLTRISEAQKQQAAVSTVSALDGLRKLIPAAMQDWKVPGLAIAIVRNGEVIFSEGFGYRDAEKKLPVTPNTLFAIGSSTKAFTSFVVGTLVDEGKLDWNTPVKQYMPTFRLKDEFASDRMTPRDLLLHISGLPRHDLMWYNSPLTRQEIIDRLQYLEPTAGFRAKWQYQNMMYMTAGYLAGQVAGTSWENLVRTRIFEPLGMASSNFSVHALDTAADAAFGYEEKDNDGKKNVEKIPYRNIDAIGPAGSINSTATDMAKWVKLHLGDGKVDGKQVISAAMLHELHRPQVVIDDHQSAKELLFNLYAMGWMVQAYHGHRLLHHGGNIDGFSALVTFMPDDDIGMVILTNMNSSPLPDALMLTAYDRLLGFDSVDWSGKVKAQIDKVESAGEVAKDNTNLVRVPDTRPSHKLADYAGEYENPGYGVLRIDLDHDRLKATYNGLTSPLEHFHYDVFIATKGDIDQLKFQFESNINGDIDHVSTPFEPQVAPIVFTRRIAAADSASLAMYAGHYVAAGGGPATTFAVRRNTLTLTVPGQPTYELIPYKENEFKLKDLNGFSVRFTVEKGKATKVTFVQPNGVFVALRSAEEK